MRKTLVVLFIFILSAAGSTAQDGACVICERAERVTGLMDDLAYRYWPEFKEDKYRVPLFYFTDSNTYMMLADNRVKQHFVLEKVPCHNSYEVYKYKRLDNVPFHMENKMDIGGEPSVYYRDPVMFCSDAETASKLIGDVRNTEEWMAMVFHEYFHGFQFTHKYTMDYMADTLRASADTLIQLYRKLEWFRSALAVENEWLLKATKTGSIDSVNIYGRNYLRSKANRRSKFKTKLGYDISSREDFWEKIEGTARYVEYNLAFVFQDAPVTQGMGCDTLFNHYQTYKKKGFVDIPWMNDKTEIMPAYYYVTGFNMCRVLDKLGVKYKDGLFDSGMSLTKFLAEAVK